MGIIGAGVLIIFLAILIPSVTLRSAPEPDTSNEASFNPQIAFAPDPANLAKVKEALKETPLIDRFVRTCLCIRDDDHDMTSNQPQRLALAVLQVGWQSHVQARHQPRLGQQDAHRHSQDEERFDGRSVLCCLWPLQQ